MVKRKFLILLFLLVVGIGAYIISMHYACEITVSCPEKSTKETSTDEFIKIVNAKGKPVSQALTKRPLRIAFAVPLKQVSDYWQRTIDAFKGRMNELGIPVEIHTFSTRVNENRKLRTAISKAMEIEPDYISVTSNQPDDERIISSLLNNNETSVIIQNVTVEKPEWQDNPPLIYVGFDHEIGARILAREFLKRYAKNGDDKYSVLYHIRGNVVSRRRGEPFIDEMSKDKRYKLIDEYFTDGSRDVAHDAATKILEKTPDTKFIYSCATDTSFGIIDALKEKNLLGKVAVNGWGGGQSELNAIQEGELDFTVMRMNDDNGVAIAEAIRLDLEGRRDEIPQVFSGEFSIVDQKTPAIELQRLKKRAFRYSDK